VSHNRGCGGASGWLLNQLRSRVIEHCTDTHFPPRHYRFLKSMSTTLKVAHVFYDNTIAFAICLGKTEKGRRAQYWHRAQLFCMELEKLAIWESHFNMQSVAFFILSWVVFLKWPLASSRRL